MWGSGLLAREIEFFSGGVRNMDILLQD